MRHKTLWLLVSCLCAASDGMRALPASEPPTEDAAARPGIFAVQTPRTLAKLAKALDAAAAISADDVWAVGQIITHFDGSTWRFVTNPANGAELSDVAAISSNDVWAVGTAAISGGSMTLAEHWNGQAWSVIPTPTLTGQQPSFTSVVVFSDTDVWAAGSYIIGGATIQPLFEHWDGTTWTIVDGHINGNHFIAKIAAVSPSDIWAVGSAGGGDEGAPFAEHWDGTRWRPANVPMVGLGGTLNSVVALAANNVWSVGSSTLPPLGTSTITSNPIQTLIEHWNGRAWSVVPSPNIGGANVFQANRLRGVGALSKTDIWAVGQFTLPDGSNAQLALAMRWDGRTWSLAPVPDVGNLSVYFDVATLAPSSVWLVGAGGFPGLVTGFGPLIGFTPGG